MTFNEYIKLVYNKKCPTITFEITDNCNLQCSYCYQQHKSNHVMSFEIAQQFLNDLLDNQYKQYLDINECGGLILEFIGGEPFLQVELIDKILNYFLSINTNNLPWMCQITTNGTLNYQKKIQSFIYKWQNNLSLTITLDGNEQFHNACRKFPNQKGSYNIVLKAVLDFNRQYGYFPLNKITISPENLLFLSESIISLLKMGYCNLLLNPIYEHKWNITEARLYYQELKKIGDYILSNNLEDQVNLNVLDKNLFHPLSLKNKDNYCGGNGAMLAIDWKGDLFPCLRYMESSGVSYIIGNINTGITKDCSQLQSTNRINQSSIKCIFCSIAAGCGYCQAYNYQVYKDFRHRSTNICWMHKARALANIYYWNNYYKKHNQSKRMLFWLSKKDALKLIDKNEYKRLKELSYLG